MQFKKLLVSSIVLSLMMFAGSASAQCTTAFASQPSPPGTDEVWIDDSLPAGATVSTGTLTWDTNQYATGSQSFVLSGAGTQTLRIDDLSKFVKYTGKIQFYALIDECDPTTEIKVTYYTAYRSASYYWGANTITGGPIAKFKRGNIPASGAWTRLDGGAGSFLRIDGQEVTSVQFEIYGGRVWFDHVGTDGLGCTPSIASAPSVPGTDNVWIEDDFPVGSSTLGSWIWDSQQKASGTQSITAPYFGQSVINSFRVIDMSQPTNSGDNLVLYVLHDGCVTTRELKIDWFAGSTVGSVYYGESLLGGEGSAVYQGSVLSSDTWQRIEIPASTVGLDGATITSVRVQTYAGKTYVDHIGNAAP
ncbi:MAG TPA: hypothetical protein VJ276_17060 [Thermoanaerobaculia bacterium]|nr:hypothetical protein [Thermoanaerobaculia bacterium]